MQSPGGHPDRLLPACSALQCSGQFRGRLSPQAAPDDREVFFEGTHELQSAEKNYINKRRRNFGIIGWQLLVAPVMRIVYALHYYRLVMIVMGGIYCGSAV